MTAVRSGHGTDLVWPAVVPAEAAVRTVARRLPPGAQLSARLYHHPFAGMAFLCGTDTRRSRWLAPARPLLASVLVDLVSGRAFLTDPWDADELTTRAAALSASSGDALWSEAAPVLRDPAPRVTEDEAVAAGHALLPGLLARRRRLDLLERAELTQTPVRFGKPNWWVTGRSGERTVEVVVDALSGRHYVRSA
ncbi:hypothetical protein [Ornithinimicrobium pekingense]|uniref:Uncharacterized protein n=1 Tax=Ornithinimicrobium pekingense TaxID=384677 RepID=A0ABQ2FB51_9MICO|nr:hypothetical protein [Ornithinimicrobium pekingense]GGK79669.1 hypothetical protein GCM10011509_30240 [Ornithinimicrobium pekingense]